MEWVEATASTLEGARKIALQRLAATDDADVEFEVLGHAEGVWKVRARLRPTAEDANGTHLSAAARPGDPSTSGLYPPNSSVNTAEALPSAGEVAPEPGSASRPGGPASTGAIRSAGAEVNTLDEGPFEEGGAPETKAKDLPGDADMSGTGAPEPVFAYAPAAVVPPPAGVPAWGEASRSGTTAPPGDAEMSGAAAPAPVSACPPLAVAPQPAALSGLAAAGSAAIESAQTGEHYFSRLEEAAAKTLKSVKPGRVAFSTPRRMTLHETSRVDVRLTRSLDLDEQLRANLAEPVDIATIETSWLMAARLTGGAFSITNLSAEEQLVTSRDITSWAFDVTANRRGHHHLVLSIDLRLPIEGRPDVTRSIPSLRRSIDVDVKAPVLVGHFVADNWQWALGIVIGVAGLIATLITTIH